MKTDFIKSLEEYKSTGIKSAVATIGTFDGIHLGHRAILEKVRSEADRESLTPVLVTFDPHPRVVLTPDSAPPLLTTMEEKEQFIPDYFSGKVLVLTFDEKLRNLSAEEFVETILVEKVGVKKLIVGYDHALGKNRKGDTKELERLGGKYGFEVEVVGPVLHDGRPISSSRIREAMQEGNFEQAVEFLGHHYAIFGTVMRGMGLGKKLGFPTANVDYNEHKMLPPDGVYGCWAKVGEENLCGMMFIGRNFFNPEGGRSVEANLFEFDIDIYDEEIFVYPTHFIRGNRKFSSTDELIVQMKKDKESVLNIMKKEKKNVSRERAQSSNYLG
ncbi:MAG: bifunctional riboflavin kinase/FAD synthetase [Candidatus Zixiibacteriota bacterium]